MAIVSIIHTLVHARRQLEKTCYEKVNEKMQKRLRLNRVKMKKG